MPLLLFLPVKYTKKNGLDKTSKYKLVILED